MTQSPWAIESQQFASAAMIVVILLGLCVEASGQITVRNTILPAANIVRVDPPPGEEATLGMNIFDLRVGFPVFLRRSETDSRFTEITNEFGFRIQSFDLTLPEGQEEYFPTELFGIEYALTAATSLDAKWYLASSSSVGIYSDFEHIDGDHFFVEGGFFIVRRLTDRMDLGVGPAFTYAFGDPVVIPAPFVRFHPPERRWRFDMQIPRQIVFQYDVTETFQLGAGVRSLYNNYRLGDERAVDAKGDQVTVVFSDIILGVEPSIKVAESVILNLAVGSTVKRKFVVNDNAGDELFDRGMKEVIFVTAGVAVVP